MKPTPLAFDSPAPNTQERRNWITKALILAICLAGTTLPSVLPNLFYVHLANLTLVSGIFALSLWIIYSVGQLSLCHGAFAGLGAYISALLSLRAGFPPFLALIAGGLATAAAAALLGSVILRLRGVYFVLVTFLFGQMFTLVALNWAGVTNGANGLIAIPSVTMFGYGFGSRPAFFYFAFAVFLLVLLFTWALNRSTYGRAFHSIQQNINLAESCGIDTARFQVIAFAIGSGIAGIGGAMIAHYIHYVSPDTFTFHNSVAYITMLVVGGRSLLWGAIVGAAFLTPLPELLRDFEGLQHILYGAIMIVVLRILPGGLISIVDRVKTSGESR